MKNPKIVTGICLMIILNFAYIGLLSAQNKQVGNFPCDSLLKSKIVSGFMYALSGRMVNEILKPENSKCETGKYSFDIVVNNDGKIISAELNKKRSSEISEELLNEMLTSIRNSSFDRKSDAPSKQKGNITYELKFKENNN